ncbi:unnamed protein product [Protopolystoma xenopodis]|uniref:Sodium/hydrogen exchanger n=1 Tax=Protopolystoma xenopodis TaxID=117903 RepID=A0A3S5FGE0_9PLAT|nr:unnamed protein product [Protopolystoma xenopodis]
MEAPRKVSFVWPSYPSSSYISSTFIFLALTLLNGIGPSNPAVSANPFTAVPSRELVPHGAGNVSHAAPEHEAPGGVSAAAWKYHEFSVQITVMIFLIIVIFLKVSYLRLPAVAAVVPESLLLIGLGTVFGAIINFGHVTTQIETWKLTPSLFFDFLLPPIVLESAYNLYNRTFGEFLGIILIYAVVGTVIPFLIIGPVMYGLELAGAMGQPILDMDIKGYLLFSSLIVAVDPVAVLAIFQDIGVDLALYYMVFGESLLNDAVTVVLYQIMQAFAGKAVITGGEIAVGFASFFTVSLGGLIIGVIFGIATCLITRFTSSMEVIIVLMLGYFAYTMANVISWSGIISMTACGLVQASYAFHNLQPHSLVVVKNVTKVVAELSEAVIFLYIGLELFRENMFWHTGFHLWGITICIIARAISVFLLTAIINWVRVDEYRISLTEQIIMIYGGLRGAVAFSLSVLINETTLGEGQLGVRRKGTIVTATLFIILFTIVGMGMTMKPLVRFLKIRMRVSENLSLFGELTKSVLDEMLAAAEGISGEKGRNAVREFCLLIDDRYVRKVLQRDPETHDQKIVKVYEKIALKLHYATIRPSNTETALADLPDGLKTRFRGQISSYPSELSMAYMQGSERRMSEKPRYSEKEESPELTLTTDMPSAFKYRNSVILTEETFENPAHLMQVLRSAKRASLVNRGKMQEEFQCTFLDMIRSKGMALRRTSVDYRHNRSPSSDSISHGHRLTLITSGRGTLGPPILEETDGQKNLAFEPEEEVDHLEEPSPAPALPNGIVAVAGPKLGKRKVHKSHRIRHADNVKTQYVQVLQPEVEETDSIVQTATGTITPERASNNMKTIQESASKSTLFGVPSTGHELAMTSASISANQQAKLCPALPATSSQELQEVPAPSTSMPSVYQTVRASTISPRPFVFTIGPTQIEDKKLVEPTVLGLNKTTTEKVDAGESKEIPQNQTCEPIGRQMFSIEELRAILTRLEEDAQRQVPSDALWPTTTEEAVSDPMDKMVISIVRDEKNSLWRAAKRKNEEDV